MTLPIQPVLYEETIPLRSFLRSVMWFTVALALLAIGLTLRAKYDDDPLLRGLVGVVCNMLYLHTGFSSVNLILATLMTELQLTVTQSQLILRQKWLTRRRIFLRDIMSAVEGEVREKRSVFFRVLKFLGSEFDRWNDFTSDFVPTTVKVSSAGGRTVTFATRNPSGLADILQREAGRAFRSETLAMVESYRDLRG